MAVKMNGGGQVFVCKLRKSERTVRRNAYSPRNAYRWVKIPRERTERLLVEYKRYQQSVIHGHKGGVTGSV